VISESYLWNARRERDEELLRSQQSSALRYLPISHEQAQVVTHANGVPRVMFESTRCKAGRHRDEKLSRPRE
jgi:hypothetical protein